MTTGRIRLALVMAFIANMLGWLSGVGLAPWMPPANLFVAGMCTTALLFTFQPPNPSGGPRV